MNLDNGGFYNNNKYNSNSVLVGFEICMDEWCTIEELYAAYKDCRRHKTTSYSCANFERNELVNLYTLWEELNNGTYQIGQSDAFCVTRPKIREIFAATFRDRIVHHFVIMKTLPLFEEYFITDTYNCRKGKGTDYGVRRCLEFSQLYPDGWVAKCDIHGFFMSINREKVSQSLEKFLCERYKGKHLDRLLWLTKMIVLNAPEYNCRKKGNVKLWRLLPRSKSLFTNRKGYGFAIGNLTSQIYANFALCPLDLRMVSLPNIRYGRYVDDFYIYGRTLEDVTTSIQVARDELNNLSLSLHPKKVYIQPVFHGVTFIGTHIKQGRIYSSQRTVGNATNLVRFFNSFKGKEQHIESFTQRFNSYSGYLSHRLTYAIRWNLWNLLSEEVKQFVYMENMRVLKVKEKYKANVKLIKKLHDKKKICKRRVGSDSTSLYERRESALLPTR